MFLQITKHSHDSNGETICHGKFLILMEREEPFEPSENGMFIRNDGSKFWIGQRLENPKPPVRAIVAHVKMRQSGHFMVGFASIADDKIYLSGAYGNDGLIKRVPPKIWYKGIELPFELYQLWANGGGWNSCGNEAEQLKIWAKQTFKI